MALLVALGSVGMQRTGEMMALTYQHLVVHGNNQQVSLVVPESKTSNGNPQVILLTDHHLVRLVLALRPRRKLARKIWHKSPQADPALGVPVSKLCALRTAAWWRHLPLPAASKPGSYHPSLDSGTCQLAHISWTKVQTRRVFQYRLKCKQRRLRQ